MSAFDEVSGGIFPPDLSVWIQNHLTVVLMILLVFVLLVLLTVTLLYKSQQHRILRQERIEREVAGRRRIRTADKTAVFERDNYTCQICGISRDFLDSFCEGLGDNLQCLCWRCNRKKGGSKTNEQVMQMIDYGMDHLEPL